MNVFSIGVQHSHPEYLQRKIILSNQIALLIAGSVALPFVFISLIHFRPLTYIPVTGIFVCLSVLIFNAQGLHNLARIVIGVLPSSLASLYGAFLSHSGEPVIPSIALLTLSFSFLIFLIFDFREKGFLLATGIYVSFLIMSMDWLNDIFQLELDTTVITTGYLAKVSYFLSLVVGGGSIMILINQNFLAEKKSDQLLARAESIRLEMLEKENALSANLRKLEQAQEEEKKRHWAANGLTQVIKIIREQKEFNLLCDQLISFIVKYLQSNQGGLFIVNDANPPDKFLELKAAFAFERKKFVQKRIEIGEGLLGQVYLEKQYIYLREIPENYVSITSGLGTAKPRVLLLVPLMFDGSILGVLELASFKEFAPYQISFLEQLSENIAAAIQSRTIDENTRYLIAMLQKQTEEMHAQEEEMRQNMEELSSIQEEMGRKEKSYVSKIAALEVELRHHKSPIRV